MSKIKLLLNITLIVVAAMYSTSCVQSDLYDLYDEDGWFFPQSKKSKGDYDSHNPTPEQVESFFNGAFTPNENECVACALYNFAGSPYNDYYSSRAKVGSTLLDWCGNNWKIQYMMSVKYYGGIQASDSQIDNLFSSALGINRQTVSQSGIIPKSRLFHPIVEYSSDKVLELNWNNAIHYGVLVRVEDFYGTWKVIIKDQVGDNHMFSASSVINVFD